MAIIEVGIGGEYDCTNIIKRPVVTGITSLGLDHTSLLGNTIREIAWHKAGIMKEDVVCCIDPNQKDEALEVINKRSQDIGSYPSLATPLIDLQWPSGSPPRLGLYGEVQKNNASVALGLASHFLSVTHRGEAARDRVVSETIVRGLERTEWPGRSQTVVKDRVNFHLDGAHTEESIEACVQWFRDIAVPRGDSGTFRVLVFNTTGDREVRCLLTPLASLDLDLVIFTTNISRGSDSADQQNYNTNYQIQLSRCDTHTRVWSELMAELSSAAPPTPCVTLPCFDDAVTWATSHHCPQLRREEYREPGVMFPETMLRVESMDLLVTGSLHLVGGVLGFIS